MKVYFLSAVVFGAFVGQAFALRSSSLDNLFDDQFNLCSEELKDGGDYKVFAKELKVDLKARDAESIYLSSTIKPFIRESGLDLETFEIDGMMSPDKARQALGKNVPRSYDMELRDNKIVIWPAVWKGSQRIRLALEPTLIVPAAKVDPSIVAAMKNKSADLSVAKNKNAKSDFHATRNSKGVYEFLYNAEGKLEDMGGLDEFFVNTLDGFCEKRAQRGEWAKSRQKLNEKPAAVQGSHNKLR